MGEDTEHATAQAGGPPDQSAIHRARPAARDAAHEAFLQHWERTMSLPIVLAAIVPLLLSPATDGGAVLDIISVISWLVFLADLVVHLRCLPGYLRTPWGKVDIIIVVFTFPLYLVTGGPTRFAGLARMVRLVRVVVAARGMRRMFVLLNRVVIVAAFVLFVSAFLVQQIEGPEHGFDSYEDSLWWGIVTITTVGYGDMVPQTTPGRFVAAFLMITGIGVVGALAGTLSTALRLEPAPAGDTAGDGSGSDGRSAPTTVDASSLDASSLDERLARMEAQLASLSAALLGTPATVSGGGPAPDSRTDPKGPTTDEGVPPR